MIPLHQHPESGRIYATIKGAPGQRAQKVSLGTTSKAAARRLVKDARLDEIQLAAQADALNAEVITRLRAGKRLSVEAAVASWLDQLPAHGTRKRTTEVYDTILKRWLRKSKLAKLALAKVAESHVSAFINGDDRRKYSTRLRELVALRSFFKFCVSRGWLASSPAAGVRVDVDRLDQAQLVEKETKPLTEADIRKILAAPETPEFWRHATLVARDTGLRLYNIATLEWSTVDASLKTGRVVVFTTKGEREVDLPLTDDLRSVFRSLERNSSRYVFPAQAASIITAGPSALSHQFRRLCIRLGIEGKSFNGLRHTFAVEQMEGVSDKKLKMIADLIGAESLEQVRKMLGHAKANVTLRYLNHPKQ
jgi:integrase